MPVSPAHTKSLCPHCLRRIPARRIIHEGAVYLEKSCPEHGDLDRVLLWRNDPWPYDQWNRVHAPFGSDDEQPYMSDDPGRKGCPYDCGICPDHQQHTCTAILEVTRRCNVGCPVCFAASGPEQDSDPDLGDIEQMLQTIRSAGTCPIQISGGEPTLRDDLPAIVALARNAGCDHIQVNTNGIRLAQDADYGRLLRDAGVTDFFLQFDGVTDSVYARVRGAELLQLKLRAIERCSQLKIGVILVPTLVRNVNENQIGSIIQFAKDWIPVVKGVHFQPMTYLGRYPASPRNEDRILIPDILKAIETQTEGELLVENMVPSG
jgi:7,8-dihydro-6-hydroxymethylpterin dimethyltransferase